MLGGEQEIFEIWWKGFSDRLTANGVGRVELQGLRMVAWAAWTERAKYIPA